MVQAVLGIQFAFAFCLVDTDRAEAPASIVCSVLARESGVWRSVGLVGSRLLADVWSTV